jgi:hypothetical protein
MEHLVQLETKARHDDAGAVWPGDVVMKDTFVYVAGKRLFDSWSDCPFRFRNSDCSSHCADDQTRQSGAGVLPAGSHRQGRAGVPVLQVPLEYREADRRRVELEARNEQQGPVFKMKADPRITPVGQFLRRSSMDEIPQILNVLRGEMSIVGPRPPLPVEVARYQPWHRRRLDVKPGITCLWQIAGRSHIGFDEWMRLDMEYLRTRSLRADLAIFVKTLPAVMARRGAY